MNSNQAQTLAGVLSFLANVVLFAVKLWVGITTNSIALVTYAWHAASDSISAVFIVATARLASRKSDKEHPFGHGRWEFITSMVMSFLLTIIAFEFFTLSIERIRNAEETIFGKSAIIVLFASIIIKEVLARYSLFLGKKYDNQAIIANGWHSRSDSFFYLIALIGVTASVFFEELWWMDAVLGIFCALVILYAAYKIMKKVGSEILGKAPSEEFINKLSEIISKEFGDDLKPHKIKLHNYVTQKELTFHITVKQNMSVAEARNIVVVLEKLIKSEINCNATISVEPNSEEN